MKIFVSFICPFIMGYFSAISIIIFKISMIIGLVGGIIVGILGMLIQILIIKKIINLNQKE